MKLEKWSQNWWFLSIFGPDFKTELYAQMMRHQKIFKAELKIEFKRYKRSKFIKTSTLLFETRIFQNLII